MNANMIGLEAKDLVVLRAEIKGYLHHRRSLHLIPLYAVGVFLVAWVYPVAPPTAVVIVVVFAALESQYNNIFFRTPNELEIMSLFPLSWRRVVLLKNLCTLLLTVSLLVLFSMGLLVFSPQQMTLTLWGEGCLYVSSVVFPLMYIGNSRSLREPRKLTGFRITDLMETMLFMLDLGIASIPFYLTTLFAGGWSLCLVYAIMTVWIWYRYSVNATVIAIEKEGGSLWSRR